MKRFRLTENFNLNVPDGDFDSHTTAWTFFNGAYDSIPKPQQSTFLDIKEEILGRGSQVYDGEKLSLPAYCPAVFRNGLTRKFDDGVLGRSSIALDFDDNPDIDVIFDQLKDYCFIAWSTYSHKTAAKNGDERWRILLPMNTSFSLSAWKDEWSLRFRGWANDCGFEGRNKLDVSCWNLAQIAVLPAINPEVGYCEVVLNDVGVKLFDPLVTPEIPPEERSQLHTTYDVEGWTPSSEQAERLVTFLAAKPVLVNIDANPTNENKGLNRKTIAAAFQSLALTYGDFERLDVVMRKTGSNTSTKKAWKDALALRVKHAGILIKLLTHTERQLVGISGESARAIRSRTHNTWDVVADVDYLSIADYGHSRRVIVNADMGTGKNYCWNQHANTATDRVIVLAPLRTIVGQQGSSNDITAIRNVTFTYDQSAALLREITEGTIKPEHCRLVIDECHNLRLAAFRIRALKNVEKLLALPFKQIIFQSATVSPSDFDGFCEFDARLRFVKRNRAELSYHQIWLKAPGKINAEILERVRCASTAGQKTLVLWNNSAELESTRSILEKSELRAEIVNAKTVRIEEAEAYDLATNPNYVMGELDALIGTTSVVEGISIKDELDQAIVIIVGKEPPQYLKQLCGRFRNARRIACVHLMVPEPKVETYDEYLLRRKAEISLLAGDARKLSELAADYGYADHVAFARNSDVIRRALETANRNGLFFNEVTKRYEQTALAQLFAEAEAEQVEFYSDTVIGHELMEDQDFTVVTLARSALQGLDEELREELTDATAAERKLVRERIIAERAERAQPILNWLGVLKKSLGNKAVKREHFDQMFSDYSGDSVEQELRDALAFMCGKERYSPSTLISTVEEIVKGKQSASDIAVRLLSESAKTSVQHYLRGRYPTGTVLSVEQQRGVICEALEFEMAIAQGLHEDWDRKACFEYATRSRVWDKLRWGQVRLVDDTVVVEIERPAKFISRNYLDMVTKRVRVGKKLAYIGEVE